MFYCNIIYAANQVRYYIMEEILFGEGGGICRWMRCSRLRSVNNLKSSPTQSYSSKKCKKACGDCSFARFGLSVLEHIGEIAEVHEFAGVFVFAVYFKLEVQVCFLRALDQGSFARCADKLTSRNIVAD